MYRDPTFITAESKRCRRRFLGTLLISPALLLANGPVSALVINPTYDTSVSSAPAGFKTAFQSAVGYFQTTFSDPITVNINVGWGEIAGNSIASGALGESITYLAGYYSYGQVRNALTADRKSAADTTALASLPAADPTGGKRELMATAEAEALKLISYSGRDGYVGFDATARWTFDPSQRAVAGAYDFIGVAEHEVSEVLGRISDLGTFSSALDPLDLFRYSSSAHRALTPGNGQYFSINGGVTNLATFNGTGGGDLGDWAGYTVDAYNAAARSGVMLPLSTADLTVMDALGYDVSGQSGDPSGATTGNHGRTHFGRLAAEVPEPSGLGFLAAALASFGFARHRRGTRSARRQS